MDIVERLRNRMTVDFDAEGEIQDVPDKECIEAADEIDRLRNYLRMILWSNRKHLTAEGNHTVEGHKLCIRIAKDALKELE